MNSIREVAGQGLIWAQTRALKHEYELHAGDELVATLPWLKTFGSLARGEMAGEAWTFKRAGFLRPRVTIREAESDGEIATFEARWFGGGTLELGGKSFRFETVNFWGSEQAWTDASGASLVHFKGKSSLLKSGATVTVEPTAVSMPELALTDSARVVSDYSNR